MTYAETETLDEEVIDTPNSLASILEPATALAAAQRMQQWYQGTPQGVAHSQFGRDGRRFEGRLNGSLDDEHGPDVGAV